MTKWGDESAVNQGNSAKLHAIIRTLYKTTIVGKHIYNNLQEIIIDNHLKVSDKHLFIYGKFI